MALAPGSIRYVGVRQGPPRELLATWADRMGTWMDKDAMACSNERQRAATRDPA
jgi:hypothetical protein